MGGRGGPIPGMLLQTGDGSPHGISTGHNVDGVQQQLATTFTATTKGEIRYDGPPHAIQVLT